MRNYSCEVLILNVTQQGENNRSVCLLSAEEGVFYATLFGGGKSRFKSLVSPFNRGIIYLYKDEVKNTIKITDFDVKKYHPTFRESLYKSFAANMAAEIAIKSRCGGSSQEAFRIINGFLDGMDITSENDSKPGTIRFIWRYMGLMGVRPEISHCCQCGQSFISGNPGQTGLLYKGAYFESENGFVCSDCTSMDDKMYVLDRDAITYLEATASLSPSLVRKITISGSTLTQLKNFCFFIIQFACGCNLKSIESGLGIL